MINDHEIIKLYQEGSSLNELSKRANLSVYKIKKILQTNDIKIRTRFEQTVLTNQKRAFPVNHNYFDILNNENTYYLGFIAADGCVSSGKRNDIKIGLSSIDEDWLIKFKENIKSERPLRHYTTGKGFQVTELHFSSLKIKTELAKYSIVPNKTEKGITMDSIPQEYKLSWIKGFFDGDGSFVYNKNTKQCMIKFTSHTKNILEEINLFFQNKGNIYIKENNYSLEFSTLSSLAIMEKFYKINTPCLVRKKEKYELALLSRI